MAHQAHAIPWHTLTSNLVYLHRTPRNHGTTNLYLRKTKDPNQVKQIRHFVRGFSRALSAYATIERTKYAPDATPPDNLDEILISDVAVRKIAKTVLQYKTEDNWSFRGPGESIITLPSSLATDSILTSCERSVRSFVCNTMPGEGDMFPELRETCEQTKALLMHGEMDTLFRLAAHPDVWFSKMWCEEEWANAHGFGLSKLLDSTLQAYICLNVIFLRPELYDDASQSAYIQREKAAGRTTYAEGEYDYRLTAAYQRMLLLCTGVPYGFCCDAHTFPHRDFFGVKRGMYRHDYSDTHFERWQKTHLGTQRVKDLVCSAFKGVHVPNKRDVAAVLEMLGSKGLPVELALQVIAKAEYVPVGRLPIRDDPFHLANAEELRKYISYCWKLLVRLEMLYKESVHGLTLDWEAEVSHALYRLFNMGGGPLFTDVFAFEDHYYSSSVRPRILLAT
ncbi:hypothetical protein PMIN04_000801 [Paraphaeosphaeria minitans]|uniref:Uncharacterized protein n=1 Tax=Paraphaeosphaeria minitans TaxID=565426 RepID=A0A9P6KWG9_9PLEO|nr:hypothetical protein PMIN01_00954 [Paraphaeosphaeria minitans]